MKLKGKCCNLSFFGRYENMVIDLDGEMMRKMILFVTEVDIFVEIF